jgi:5-(carboxyamino)imidazole ribonucleotide synthase
MLGGGQLGRMFTDAAHALNYRVHVFCPEPHCPAAQVADQHTAADYDDLDAVAEFARSVAAVTYEFENVPADTAAACAKHAPVRPGTHVLAVAQNRVLEKQTLRRHGIPVGDFAPIDTEDDLHRAVQLHGLPGVLKTARGGYDGKGQRILRLTSDITYAWEDLGRRPCIYEAFVDFEQEVSVVAARAVDPSGAEAIRTFGPIANTHRNHILDVSVVPSGAPAEVEQQALDITRRVMQALDVVGVLCVEFFQTRPGPGEPARMLVNELAPRPHNSGHLTLEAFTASQFDQQVRAVAGLPLADAQPVSPAAMVNLLGDLWPPQSRPMASAGLPVDNQTSPQPDWSILQPHPHLHLHLYGKSAPRPGRKMGHLTALARTPHEAIRDAVEARVRLAPRPHLAPD